jgi:hypothetical protein
MAKKPAFYLGFIRFSSDAASWHNDCLGIQAGGAVAFSVSNEIDVRRAVMKESYGELMGQLLRYQGRYPQEEEFRAFLRESVRTLARDLKAYDIELALVSDAKAAQAAGASRKNLKIGCE